MKQLKCYYAHPITSYGTMEEAGDVRTLERLGFEVVNPNTPEMDKAYKTYGMSVFLELVSQCDVLAFRAFSGGDIPAGVCAELSRAEARMMPVFEIGVDWIDRRLSVDATRQRLKERGRNE